MNYHQIRGNKSLSHTQHYHRDGALRVDGNGELVYHYHPNSFDEVIEYPDTAPPPFLGTGSMNRYNHRVDEDYFSQAGDLFRLIILRTP